MRPPGERPHRFCGTSSSSGSSAQVQFASLTILGVLAVPSEPSVKPGTLVLRHAQPTRLPSRHRPADASTVPQPALPRATRPHAGALAGAAARPPGRALANQHSVAAAFSNAPALERESPTTPPHGAMQRGRRRRENPARITRPRRRDTRATSPPFQRLASGQSSSRGVEPFLRPPDKTLPGTLHHSGNRPAPPSDYTPLARRSAFWRADRPALRSKGIPPRIRGWGLPGGKPCFLVALAAPAGICQPTRSWSFAFPLPVIARGCWSFHALRRESTLGSRQPRRL
jgi:hypothetical protein